MSAELVLAVVGFGPALFSMYNGLRRIFEEFEKTASFALDETSLKGIKDEIKRVQNSIRKQKEFLYAFSSLNDPILKKYLNVLNKIKKELRLFHTDKHRGTVIARLKPLFMSLEKYQREVFEEEQHIAITYVAFPHVIGVHPTHLPCQ
jgi:hypothetical protein